MITHVIATMRCDKCGSEYRFVTAGLTAVRRKAERNGWHTGTGKDFCPNCHPITERPAPVGRDAGEGET